MDAAQLARWTRFAVKGGIGKCTATCDCVAQDPEDLMFFNGDEIVVLMRIPNVEDCYLGSCEGVIGRFSGQGVRFHGKLKRPVMTKRSSVSATKSPSPHAGVQTPTPSLSRSNSLSSKKDQNAVQPPPSSPPQAAGSEQPVSLVDDVISHPPPLTISASFTPPVSIVVTPQLNITQSPPGSNDPESSLSTLPTLSQSPQIVLSTSPPISPSVVSPLNIIKKKSPSSPLLNSTFAAAQEQLLRSHTFESISVPDNSFSTYDEPSSGGGDSDGEVGIGLSLLQSLADGTDSDDDSVEHANGGRHDGDSADGSLYDEPQYTQTSDETTHLGTGPDQVESQSGSQAVVSFPSELPSPQSSASSKSFSSLQSPPLRSSVSSRRPSVQSSSSWDGDIYDDYRYSRASMVSRARRSSASSRLSTKASPRDVWDGHVYEQPPPIPDSRPSIDSALMNELSIKTSNDSARKSADSKKSMEVRRSAGSRKSTESDSRRSRQELLFPQPPTNVNIQPDLLDQAARESLRRSSEASRIRTPADFRLSVESEASVYSHLSIIEQESPTLEAAAPASSDSPKHDSTEVVIRPPSLELTETQSPLLHTSWSSSISSPSRPTFTSTTNVSPATSLLMPTAFTNWAAGMVPVTGQKMELNQQDDTEVKGEENLRNIVVDDDEEIPADVVQETTFDSEYSHDTTLDSSNHTIILPKSIQAAGEGYMEPRAPSPPSPLPLPNELGGPSNPSSPVIPSHPPFRDGPSTIQSSTSLSFQSAPSALTMQATANHLRPSGLTLADLREGGGAMIPETGRRRSLFNPHPNAPKALNLTSQGPMFISSQEPSSRQSPIVPDTTPRPSVFAVMHMALRSPLPPALRPRMMAKGPTIYGKTDIDLSMSNNPVPITFSTEPFPYHPPEQPPLQQPSSQLFPISQTLPHQSSPLQQPPSSPNTSLTLGVQRPPIVVITASSSSAAVPENKPVNTGEGETTHDVDRLGNTTDTVPLAGFLVKGPGMRPRSRSFSSFDLPSISAEAMPTNQESSAAQTTPDMPRSLKPTVRRSSTVSSAQELVTLNKTPLRSSPLRPSPLKSSPKKLGIANPTPRSPSSPLSLFFRASPSSSLPPSPSAISIPSLHVQNSLRQAASSVTLNESALSRSSLSLNNASESSSFISKPSSREPLDHVPSGDQAEHEPISPQSDNQSSPVSSTHRQSSLRAKLSLPNLRRNWNKSEEASLASPLSEHEVSGTVQVEDLDFELIRPTLPFQNARISEESVSRETMAEVSVQDGGPLQLPGSPTSSLGGAKSPSAESFSWPRPSISSTAAPIITRATADTESNMDAHRQRESKWMSLIASLPPSQWRKSKKVKKLIQEGVPSSVRYLIWSNVTDGKAKVVPRVYQQLANRDRIAAASMIEEDIKTCFQDQPHLQGKRGPVLTLLQAYLSMVPDIQYTMGLTLIAGQLLLHTPEEDAFWIFVSVMDTHIRPYFSSNSSQLEVDATLFNRVVENNDPELAKKLYSQLGIEPVDVCATWFSTLFVSALPPEHVNRVWDLFLYEGIPLLLRVGLAVMICCRRQILGAISAEVALQYLRHPSPGWLPSSPDGFLTLVNSVKMKDDDIRKTRLKMEAQVKRQAQAQNPRHLPITTTISLPRP